MMHRITKDRERKRYLVMTNAYMGDGTNLYMLYSELCNRCQSVTTTRQNTNTNTTILPVSLSFKAIVDLDTK